MNALVERDWVRGTVNVWLYRRAGEARTLVLEIVCPDEIGHIVREREVGIHDDKGAPTFVLPEDAFEALIAAGADVFPPDRAQARHLDDAIKVRDRLLDLWTQPQINPPTTLSEVAR